MGTGRFAPSPTGTLHVGNLRTALLAWLFARSQDQVFRLRMEDLDPVASRTELARRQLEDLAAAGIDWDGPVVNQSDRRSDHEDAISDLDRLGLLYPCYCTRREIAEAARAAHGPLPEGAYPGTCRDLDPAALAERSASGRPPALRLRTAGETLSFTDRLHGVTEARLDDMVIRRNDGVPAYNLAVVVDDAAMGVTEVVRGDDLLVSTPRQIHLARLLGLAEPVHAHVPLVLGPDGERLSKRHGAVDLETLASAGVGVGRVRSEIAASLGLVDPGEPVSGAHELLGRFSVENLPTEPWVADPSTWAGS